MESRFGYLGDQIEKGDADDQPRREGHDVEQIALIAEREGAPGKGHHECGERVNSGHQLLV